MEKRVDDVNVENLSMDEINEMEERRIDKMNEAGIDEEKVLERARKNLNTWNSYFNENIVRGKDDMNFVLRDQWTAVERSEFTRLFKPAMTFNKLYDATKKIIGEQRKNKPDLLVRSLTGKATQEQINLREDLVRTISYQSQNNLVYQVAFKSALMLGFGAFQVCLDYKNSMSFEKIIRYDIITDPTMCSWDVTALKPHKGDGNSCSRRYVFTRDEFFATYPYVVNPVSYIDPYMLLDFQWTTRDTIIVADEFVKEWFPLVIYNLAYADGSRKSVTKDQWKVMEKEFENNKEYVKDAIVGKIVEREIPRIIAERQTQDYRIMHYRMIKDMIIDFSVWPSKQLPILFVDGDSYYIEGRQYTKSFIHEARDAQKLHNYSKCETAAELKNRRREQWMGTPDNIIGYEQDWRNPELQVAMLRARPDPKTGAMPTKMQPSEVPQGLFVTAQATDQDMREIMGFSENEQLQGRDISGKARRERKLEGSMSAYVFLDNLNQAIEQSGRIVNDLLPYIIGDEERHMVINKKDGKSDNVIINKREGQGDNEVIKNKIDNGEFDVEIDTGPSFAVQKSVSLEFLNQILMANPQIFPLVGDLYAQNLDVAFMPQLKDRLQTLVPPEIIAKEKGVPPPPPQPNPQMQMMQEEIKNKQAEVQIKMQQLQLEQQELELKKAEMLLKAQDVENKNTTDIYKHQLDLKKAEAVHGLDRHKTHTSFTTDIAKILSDIHKQEQQHHHEKHLQRMEPKPTTK